MIKKVLNWLLSLRVRYNGSPEKLKRAVERANKLHEKNGRRYRVVFINGKYRHYTRVDVQQKKHAGEWGKNVNMTRLENFEFYDTTDGFSSEGFALIKKLKNHGIY